MRHTKQTKTYSRSRLGPILRQYRATKNMAQKDLCPILKLSKAQISKLEAGKHKPSEDTVLRILEFLIIDFDARILELEARLEQVSQRLAYNSK
jgi:transcriptional regulator with XRE-family HTH domain